MSLPSTVNDEKTERYVLSWARDVLNIHDPLANFEHGQWWITCKDCGGQWSVVDVETDGDGDFDFEEVTRGDESCLEQEAGR